MKFEDRYALAVRSSNLRSDDRTMYSSVDILGAAGKASVKHPLSLAVLRLFLGDKHAVPQIVDLLTLKAVGKAYRMNAKIDQVSASLLSRLVLDWYRDPVCKQCGGHRFKLFANTPKLSDQACGQCHGSGKRDFESMFPSNRVELARWLAAELEREAGMAEPAAMAALAPRRQEREGASDLPDPRPGYPRSEARAE